VKLIDFKNLGPLKGINYSRDPLRRKWKASEFPKPIRVSAHQIGWIEAEVDAWLDAKERARDAIHNPSHFQTIWRLGARAPFELIDEIDRHYRLDEHLGRRACTVIPSSIPSCSLRSAAIGFHSRRSMSLEGPMKRAKRLAWRNEAPEPSGRVGGSGLLQSRDHHMRIAR